MKKRRTVYSTEKGRMCPTCGWPLKECCCSRQFDQPVPDRITARLRIEKAGRRGKTVTIVYGLPRNTTFLKELAKELKKSCGAGGTIVEDRIEIQGEKLESLRKLLAAKGWIVKG